MELLVGLLLNKPKTLILIILESDIGLAVIVLMVIVLGKEVDHLALHQPISGQTWEKRGLKY